MIIDKNLLNSFINTSTVNDLNTLVKKLFADLNTKIEVSGEVPSDVPVLLVSNHPGAIDSFIISSYAKRNDSYFVGITKFMILGEVVKKTLLPAYNKPKLDEKIINIVLSKTMNYKHSSNISLDEMRQKNRATITKAAELVNNGKMVSIFPTGGGGKSVDGISWKAGVGFLAKQIKNPNTALVFANISGTKPTDYVVFAASFLRKLLYRPQPITIKFSEPIILSEVINQNEDGKQITSSLEKLYNRVFRI